MRIGFNLLLWTTHVTPAHLPILRSLKAAGYDGVEVPIFEGTPAHYTMIRQMLADTGLAATGVGIVPDAAHDPTSADPAARAGGQDHLSWLVDCAHALGSDVLCGPFHQPLGQFSGAGATPAEWDNLVAAHQKMADYAGPDLTLSVEPLNRFECYILNTAADSARLAADVGRSNYGYLYDTFHANIEERDPSGVIAPTIQAITHVHISENYRGTPGRGHADILGALKALKRAGYDDWLTVEAFGQALPDLAAATRVWRPLFGSEAEVYQEAITLIRQGWAKA